MDKKKKLSFKQRVACLLPTSLMTAMPTYASSDPGVKANTWVQKNVGALIPAAIVIVAIVLIIKRDWIKLISFVGILIVVAMILDWESVKSIGESLRRAIFG